METGSCCNKRVSSNILEKQYKVAVWKSVHHFIRFICRLQILSKWGNQAVWIELYVDIDFNGNKDR